MKLIIASNNEGKIKEFKKMLTPLGYEPVSMREAGINIDIAEDGTTFSENAHIKAKTICLQLSHRKTDFGVHIF